MAGHPLADKVSEIRRWHVQERGWRDIGYHWITALVLLRMVVQVFFDPGK